METKVGTNYVGLALCLQNMMDQSWDDCFHLAQRMFVVPDLSYVLDT